MRFICSARSAKEQNMAAYQYGQNIYYRSIQDIPVGEELLVWYSDSYLKHLGIPMVLKETEQLNIDGKWQITKISCSYSNRNIKRSVYCQYG